MRYRMRIMLVVARIDEQLTGGNKSAVKDACKFVMKLKGKKVIVIDSEAK